MQHAPSICGQEKTALEEQSLVQMLQICNQKDAGNRALQKMRGQGSVCEVNIASWVQTRISCNPALQCHNAPALSQSRKQRYVAAQSSRCREAALRSIDLRQIPDNTPGWMGSGHAALPSALLV